MTIQDKTIGMNRSTTSFGPFSYGSKAGQPTIDFTLSVNEDNHLPVQSVERNFASYSWKKKVNSGFARLRFSGNNILEGDHDEGMGNLCRLLGARFVDVEVGTGDITSVPSRELNNLTDFYSVFVPLDRDFDEEAFEFFVDQSNKYGNVEFLFKFDTEYKSEGDIKDIVMDYGIYDSHVWIYRKGRKPETVSERYEDAAKIAKRHSWNLSPRMAMESMLHEEIDEIVEERLQEVDE